MRFATSMLTAAAVIAFTPANADTPITGTMSATYYTVTAGGSGDFQTYCCSDARTDLVLGTLGPNGLPVYNSASVGPQTMTGVDPVTGELQWWTPGLTAGGDTVVQSGGPTTVSFPFNDMSFFPPDGSGGGNGGEAGFLTARFDSILNLDRSYRVTFSLSGDDDAFLFIGNQLFTGLGGVHPITAAPTVTKVLGPGQYSFNLFFADRHTTDSRLSISGSIAAVPEPATWAMLIAGFGMVGFAARRRNAMAANA